MSYNPTPYPNTSTTTSAADAPRADAASLTGLPAASAPAHHLHKSSDVLPGAQHAQGAQTDVDHHHTHTRAPVPALQPDSHAHAHAHESHTGARRNAPGPRGGIERQPELELDADGRNAWTEEPARPLGARSAEHGACLSSLFIHGTRADETAAVQAAWR